MFGFWVLGIQAPTVYYYYCYLFIFHLFRSVYVGNVDYGSTAEQLEQHFSGCGQVNRVTILCNKFDGSPKGFAYIEFVEQTAVRVALMMDQTLFRGRKLKVGYKVWKLYYCMG